MFKIFKKKKARNPRENLTATFDVEIQKDGVTRAIKASYGTIQWLTSIGYAVSFPGVFTDNTEIVNA